MKRRAKSLYNAFPLLKEAKKAANSLNLAAGVGPARQGMPARARRYIVRKLRSPQAGGRLKYGVYVNTSCKVYI